VTFGNAGPGKDPTELLLDAGNQSALWLARLTIEMLRRAGTSCIDGRAYLSS
jgi:hypothetical protein